MNNCKYLKIKLNKTFECKKKKKIITLNECANCQFKEYKRPNYSQNCAKLKNRTSKQAKLERKRFSLFSKDTKHCYFCSSGYELTWHEIFRGRNRQNSMKYGLCLRMCSSCHELYQEDKYFNDLWHAKGQAMFEETYPDLDFVKIFKKNYR